MEWCGRDITTFGLWGLILFGFSIDVKIMSGFLFFISLVCRHI